MNPFLFLYGDYYLSIPSCFMIRYISKLAERIHRIMIFGLKNSHEKIATILGKKDLSAGLLGLLEKSMTQDSVNKWDF